MREKKQNWYVNQKKYHFIYKTTCKINSKYYIGMHSTDFLDDGYIGSGTRLWHSIKKHGRENFSIEILEFLPDRESLKKREAELVNDQQLTDSFCLNIRLGGEGGWEHLTSEQKSKAARKTWESNPKLKSIIGESTSSHLRLRYANDEAYRLKMKEIWKAAGNTAFSGKCHSEETRIKIGQAVSAKQSGSLNSQFGTRWITNEIENRKINKTESLPENWRFGRINGR